MIQDICSVSFKSWTFLSNSKTRVVRQQIAAAPLSATKHSPDWNSAGGVRLCRMQRIAELRKAGL